MKALTRTIFALVAAIAALADNATTWMAISAGAVELNPLVIPFTHNPLTFSVFTVFKVVITFYLVHRYYSKSRTFFILYFTLIILFAQATVTNIVNSLTGR